MKTKTIVFLFSVLAIFLFQKDVALAGFGVSPPTLSNKNLVPGSFYEQTIYLVQSKPDVDLKALVTVDAGEINNWIKIENGNNFTIPKGTQQFPMKISVTVPSDAEFKKYKGTITVSTSPVNNQQTGVSVTLGADISIDLDVTSLQVSDFSIQNFKILDVVKGSPIKFVIKVKNDGNISNGPTKVGLTFFDQYHDKQLGQQEVLVNEKVASFQTKDITAEFSNDFDLGQYWADVKIYNQDLVIVDSKIVFTVLKEGTIVDGAKGSPKIPSWTYYLAIIVLVAVVAVVILIRLLKRKKKHKKKKT